MPFQIRRYCLVADIDPDFAQRHPGVERDQRSVPRVGRDSRRGDRYLMIEAERVELAPQNMFGHHASRGVGRADEEDRTKARLTRSRAFRFHIGGQKSLRVKMIYTPPPITSPMLSFLETPLAISSLSLAPSSAGSHIDPFFETLAAVCHPFMIQTLPMPTRTTSPWTSLASSLERHATSGATCAGVNASHSPAFCAIPPAVCGVASTVSRVRATGAIALAVTP